MFHEVLRDASFFSFLLKIDEDLAEEARRLGCGLCGEKLYRGDYARKPRGGAELGEEHSLRFSFCCSKCRKRSTPPSVRFLARKVYWGAVVVLAAAMQQGPSARRVAKLQELLGIGRRTLARWRGFWEETFVASRFWKAQRAQFMPPCEETRMPKSLLERFDPAGGLEGALTKLLSFLSPITTRTGVQAMGF